MLNILFISRPTLFSTPGGDTIQMLNTKSHLEKHFGIQITILSDEKKIDYSKFDLIHFFNLIRPNNILPHLDSGLPYVISPIYVDYSEYDQKVRGGFIAQIAKRVGKGKTEYLKSIIRWLKNKEHPGSISYLFKGYNSAIKEILQKCSFILPNSKSELARIKEDFHVDCRSIIVPNAVDTSTFNYPSTKYKEGIVCVARIEGLKNQLNLIKAVMLTDYKLTIIGKPAPNHIDYYNKCLSKANDQISFIDHVEQGELQHYYRKSKVHAMISWFETTGLSSLEAASCGCNIVISDKGDQKEYFQKDGFYADPQDVDAIKKALEEAYNAEPSSELMERIATDFNWNKTAELTMEAYSKCLKTDN